MLRLKSSRNGNPNRDPAPASSSSTPAPTIRTTSWSPSAAAKPSCASAPIDAHAAEGMRSLLFAPADSDRKLDKAFASGTDAVIIDLEDSVALDNKPLARERAARFL